MIFDYFYSEPFLDGLFHFFYFLCLCFNFKIKACFTFFPFGFFLLFISIKFSYEFKIAFINGQISLKIPKITKNKLNLPIFIRNVFFYAWFCGQKVSNRNTQSLKKTSNFNLNSYGKWFFIILFKAFFRWFKILFQFFFHFCNFKFKIKIYLIDLAFVFSCFLFLLNSYLNVTSHLIFGK